MIKSITSVPVVRKALTGTMLVASLLGGAASCSRPAKTTGETNVSYTESRKSNVDQISYEKNLSQMSRTYSNETKEARYKDFGLYFGTIINQLHSGASVLHFISNAMYPEGTKYSAPDPQKYIEQVKQADNVSRATKIAGQDYREFTEAKYLRDLYENTNGVPTAKECSDYLDRRIASLDISSADYNKCLEQIEDFKKAQGKQDNQKFAEYLAYKQFLIDSVNARAILRDLGYLKEPKIRTHFEQKAYDPEYAGGIRPTP